MCLDCFQSILTNLEILLKIKRKLELNMYLDIRFYLKYLPFFILFYLFGSSHRRCSVEVSVLGGFAGFAGEFLYRGLFFKLLVSGLRLCSRGGSGAGVYSCRFCEIFESVFFTELLLDGCFCLPHL